MLVVVSDQPVVAVAENNGRDVGHQEQSMPTEIQVAVQGLPHHAADIGATGIGPALVHLPRNRCAADVVVLFQHDDVEPGLCEVRGVCQAVMTCADDNGVVVFHRRISRAAL